MAKVASNSYFRNSFSAGAKPRLLIEIGREYDATRGHFKYPTFFRNFCYGGNLRVENIHSQEISSTTQGEDNACKIKTNSTELLVNGEYLDKVYSVSPNLFNTDGGIKGIDSSKSFPYGVFTRGDTIEFIKFNEQTPYASTFIMGGSNGGSAGIQESLFNSDDEIFIKPVSELSNDDTAAYRMHRDYFDEVISPPVIGNSCDKLGGFASTNSVSFSLANIKDTTGRKNWSQTPTSSTLSDYWSQFLYNQTGDALDNIETIAPDWGIENSEVRIYLVYCEDTLYRGKCKITRTDNDKITWVAPGYKWTYYNSTIKNVGDTGDIFILHNKVSDGSVDANCRTYPIDIDNVNEDHIFMSTGYDFTTGADDDEYYYSIKRKDSILWRDYYEGRVLLFNGRITTVSNISKSDITLTADSKVLTDMKTKMFGWEKIDPTITSYGINKHLNHSSLSFGNSTATKLTTGEGKTMPIMFGDTRLFNIHATPNDGSANDILTGYGVTFEADPTLSQIQDRDGLLQGINSYITPIPIADKSITTLDYAWKLHDETDYYWTQSGVTIKLEDHANLSERTMTGGQRHAKGKAFLISKYPLFMHEHFCDGSSTKASRFQTYPSRISGELTLKSGDTRGMLFPQRFRCNDSAQGTIIWGHIDDERSAESEGQTSTGSATLDAEECFRSSETPANGHYYPDYYLKFTLPEDAPLMNVGTLLELSGSRMYNASIVPIVEKRYGSSYSRRGFWVDMGVANKGSDPFQWSDDGGCFSGGFSEEGTATSGLTTDALATGKGEKEPSPSFKGSPISLITGSAGNDYVTISTCTLQGAGYNHVMNDNDMFDPGIDSVSDPVSKSFYVDIWHTVNGYYDVDSVKVDQVAAQSFRVLLPEGNRWDDIKGARETAATGNIGGDSITRTDISFSHVAPYDELNTTSGTWFDLRHDPDSQNSLSSSNFPVDTWFLISGATNAENNGYKRLVIHFSSKRLKLHGSDFVTEAAGASITVKHVTPVGFWDFAGNKTVNWKVVSSWGGGVKDYPHVRWCLLPSSELYSKGGSSSFPLTDNVIDWKNKPDMSDYSTLNPQALYGAAYSETAETLAVSHAMDMQEFPGGFAPHYHLKHHTGGGTGARNWGMADLNCFRVFTSMFVSRSSATNYTGFTTPSETYGWFWGMVDNLGSGLGGGLAVGYSPEWEDNNTGLILSRMKPMSSSDISSVINTPARMTGGVALINGDFISSINKGFVVGLKTDQSGIIETDMEFNYASPITNGDPFLYLYHIQMHVDTFQSVSPSDIVYNGYGSPVGGWCSNRTASNADGFDEEHADNLTARTSDWTGTDGKLTTSQFGLVFTSTNRYSIANFEDSGNPFSSVVPGDILVVNKASTPGGGNSTSNSLTCYTSPPWAKMSGSNGFVSGEFIVGRKATNGKLQIVDPYGEYQNTPGGAQDGTQTPDLTSLWSSHYTNAIFPSTTITNGTSDGGDYQTNLGYAVYQGKAAINPVTQLEQLVRWELFWDSTAIDENSFNTASNDRSDWEGFILIEEETPVQEFIHSFSKTFGMAAFITADGKLKVKAHESSDPYTATQVQNRNISSSNSSTFNAPSEALNLCSSNPHIGWKFGLSRYQTSGSEFSHMKFHESSSSSFIVNFDSSDNTNDPIEAGATLQSKLRAGSPADWDYIVSYNSADQEYKIYTGDGANEIYAIGESGTNSETVHDSLCNQFGFFKGYRLVGNSLVESDFAVSSLPIYGHVIIKGSFTIKRTPMGTLINEITIKYNNGFGSINISSTASQDKYGILPETYEATYILEKVTATNYGNYLLERLSFPKIIVGFDLAGTSGIIFEVWDHIAISHELLQSVFGNVYNSHLDSDANANLKFRILATSYSASSNKVRITAEEI